MTTKAVIDELESIASMFCAKYPDRSVDEIDTLVGDVYARLALEATVTAHLIPLTVYRCHKLLAAQRRSVDDGLEAVGPMTLVS